MASEAGQVASIEAAGLDDMPQLEGSDEEIAVLRRWIEKKPARVVHENMMKWQKCFTKRCGRVCCFSAICGRIRCDGCTKSLTAPAPAQRYMCVECPVPEEPAWEPATLCHECFTTGAPAHEHGRYLCVDEAGVHSLVTRTAGVFPRWPWRPAHFPVIEPAAVAAAGQTECAACLSEFEAGDADAGAVSMPGCGRGHGAGRVDDRLGMVDDGWLCCACAVRWLAAKGYDGYCAPAADATPPMMCGLCGFEQEMLAWQREAEEGVAAAAKAWVGEGDADGDAAARWARAATAAVALLQVTGVPLPAAASELVSTGAGSGSSDALSASWPAFCSALAQAAHILHPQPWIAAVFERAARGAAAMRP